MFIVLVLIQVLILNNIQFSGYINPFLYVLFILLLPFQTPVIPASVSGLYFRTYNRYFQQHPGNSQFGNRISGIPSSICNRPDFRKG